MGIGSEQVELIPHESGIRLYSPRQIGAGAFVGTPMAACWMLAQNYVVLGKRGAARRALLLGLVGTVVLLGIAFGLPERFPKPVLPLAYSVTIRELAKRLQGSDFDAHLASGGERHSNWRVAVVAVTALAIVLAVAFVVVLLLPA